MAEKTNGELSALTSKVHDLLVVGGGPGGTATAFRAKELGIDPLVIDFDDLMRRIRDYPKDKQIKPNFGGGDKMQFPVGEQLISSLHFEPIDKDDMFCGWKDNYAKYGVAYCTGVELVGLGPRSGDVYEVRTWHRGSQRELTLRAKHIVVAVGAGLPRRFDIPGNTEGICCGLRDPRAFVGAPTCVIGGGTSAAEAVIAISKAKAAAEDRTLVYWSYRGEQLPKVSKALATEFFDVYFGNGNVRYRPKSEPVAVVTAEDGLEYLSVRHDRRRVEGRPTETAHLEFLKESVIACIGWELPEKLLADIGTPMVVGGPKNKKRLAVNRFLESRQPNVYFVGDLLAQAYFLTEDFDADPAGFEEVKHRGNVKAALCDGVLVAQVVKQRLEGKRDEEIETAIRYAEPPEEKTGIEEIARPVESAAPPAESVPADRATDDTAAILIRVLPGGVAEDEYPIREGAVTTIGRKDCDLLFENDTMMSDRHASISHNRDGFFLRDDGSATGVFLRVPAARKLEVADGDLIRGGRQFLLFTRANGRAGFVHYDAQGTEVGRHDLPSKTIVVGRHAPDVTLAPDDPTLSRRQLSITVEEGKILVKDLKSVNGTYLRVRNATKLEHEDQIRAGQQIFTFSVGREAVVETGPHVKPEPSELKPPAPEPVEAPAPAKAEPKQPAGGPAVTFEGGATHPAEAGQTILDVAESAGVAIDTQGCHEGTCGCDPVRIVSGWENLSEPSDEEVEALAEICEVDPASHRLACVAKIKGPVVVEVVKP